MGTLPTSLVRRLITTTLILALTLTLSLILISDLHRLLDLVPAIPLLPSHRTYDPSKLLGPGRIASPWILDPATYATGESQPADDVPALHYNVSRVRKHGMMIPDAVHYILLSPDGIVGTELSFWQYLSIRSTLAVQRPSVVYL